MEGIDEIFDIGYDDVDFIEYTEYEKDGCEDDDYFLDDID